MLCDEQFIKNKRVISSSELRSLANNHTGGAPFELAGFASDGSSADGTDGSLVTHSKEFVIRVADSDAVLLDVGKSAGLGHFGSNELDVLLIHFAFE